MIVSLFLVVSFRRIDLNILLQIKLKALLVYLIISLILIFLVGV